MDHDRKEALEDAGKLLLRLTIAGLMIFHGIAKLSGIEGITGMLEGKGLPGFIAYGVYVGEIVAPVLMILGIFTRSAALVFAFNMVVAVALAHSGDIFTITDHGAWALELHGLFFFGSVAIALLGPGKFRVPIGEDD